jgi:hypothetical protein
VSTRGITLERGSVVVLSLDGTLVYVEDVQPTAVSVVALPDQPPNRKENAIFAPGRVGARKVSPYSSYDREVKIPDLSQRNKDFLGDYEKLRQQHGPNYIARTPEELAAMSVTKAGPTTRTPRGSVSDDEKRLLKKAKRDKRKAAKLPCGKCGLLPVHVNHQPGGTCEYEAPARKTRTAKAPAATVVAADVIYTLLHEDLTAAQAASDKFKDGNRFFRVFRALRAMKRGTKEDVMAAVALDGGRPMSDVDKVVKRALQQLIGFGNVAKA